ncbi:MAG: hypothetical protein ACJ8IK_25420 [Burkholderiaceae bacterium]
MFVNWYSGGAAVIAVLFGLNALVHVLRKPRHRAAVGPGSPLLKRPQSGAEIAGALLVAAVLVVCFAAPFLAPGSDLGKAMSDPWAAACLVLWLMGIGVVVVATALTLARRRRSSGQQ